MKSSEYLYELLKRSHIEGWLIGRKRYTIAVKRINGVWLSGVHACYYDQLRSVGEFYLHEEDAWEAFLSKHYPKIMQKWRDAEENK